MPLLDHFHPPLSERRQWHSFHHAWAAVIAFDLNRQLPQGYFADPNVQFGIEIDVAAFEEEHAGGTPPSWVPPAPTMTIPLTLVTDVVEVAVYNSEAGPVLIGAIELVSPANKDRASTRDAFVSKCASFVQQGIGLVIADLVTDRKADLHADLLHRLDHGAAPPASDLWAASYRPTAADGSFNLDIWHDPLGIGALLPTLPFWLKDGPCIRLDLDATYTRTLKDQRMLAAAGVAVEPVL
jgi:hypothetical protein